MDRAMRAVAGLASALPQLVKLLARLARDPRVPVRAKRVAAALVVYAALPIDLAPDWIPLVGLADDLLAVVVGVADIDRNRAAGGGGRTLGWTAGNVGTNTGGGRAGDEYFARKSALGDSEAGGRVTTRR